MNQPPFGFTPNPGPSENEGPFDLSNMGAMLQQIGAMMQRAQSVPVGEVDWATVRQAARQAIATQPDPSVVDAERERVRAAAELAQLWLDDVTEFPAASLASAAWSRSEWLESTFDQWMPVVEPVAKSMQRGVGDPSAMPLPDGVPAELSAMLAPMMQMAAQMSTVMVAGQVGQGLGSLARDAWSASDIGLPLNTDGATALVPSNTRAWAESLQLDVRDVETYLAVREAAAQRPFAASPWLRSRLLDAIAEYASGIRVDTERLRDIVGQLDMSDPMAVQEALQGGALEVPLTPGQTAALARVELLVTLIEGWVDHIATIAIADRIASATAMREALRRRRAAGGPSEQTFATLLGLELRPRKLREASAFWAALDAAKRDDVWQHPDFLPDFDDLEDPSGYIARTNS